MLRKHYDVIICGARVAGAATAIRLARHGLQVLLIDPRKPGTDTLSTHALMRLGVVELRRLGVLDDILQQAPLISTTTFSYDGAPLELLVRPADGVPGLVAPRRSTLDDALVATAKQAGAQVEMSCKAVGLLRDSSARVVGVWLKRRGQSEAECVSCDWVIGADGTRSSIVSFLGQEVPVLHAARHATATIYAHLPYSGPGYEWMFLSPSKNRSQSKNRGPSHSNAALRGSTRPFGRASGIIPTEAGLACVFSTMHPSEFASRRIRDPLETLRSDLASMLPPALQHVPQLWERSHGGLFHYFAGHRGYLRKCQGAGWALVGDAGYFKDPLTAHGISDALRDAALLSHALIQRPAAQLERYQEERDALSLPFFRLTDEIASLSYETEDLQLLHRKLAEEMKKELLFFQKPESARADEPSRPNHKRLTGQKTTETRLS